MSSTAKTYATKSYGHVWENTDNVIHGVYVKRINFS